MIRIHNGNLIIEIKPQNQSALEKLGSIQNGLYDLMLCVGSCSAPAATKKSAVYQLHSLLQSFQLNDLQLGEIDEAISQTPGMRHLTNTSK